MGNRGISNEEPKEKVYARLSSVVEPAILPFDVPSAVPKYRVFAFAIFLFVGQVANDKIKVKIKRKSFKFLIFIFILYSPMCFIYFPKTGYNCILGFATI